MVVGLVGGLLVAVVFTLLLQVQSEGFTLPTTSVWNRYVGRLGVGKFRFPGALLLHLSIGSLIGGLFPELVSGLGLPAVYLTTFPQTLTAGLGYGVTLYVVARLAEFLGLIDLVEPGQTRHLFEYHILYGLGLGVWFGLSQRVGYPLICQFFTTVCTSG